MSMQSLQSVWDVETTKCSRSYKNLQNMITVLLNVAVLHHFVYSTAICLILSRPQRWIVSPAQHQRNFGLDKPWCCSSWKTWSDSCFLILQMKNLVRYLWRGQHLWIGILFSSSWGTRPKLPPQNSMDGKCHLECRFYLCGKGWSSIMNLL